MAAKGKEQKAVNSKQKAERRAKRSDQRSEVRIQSSAGAVKGNREEHKRRPAMRDLQDDQKGAAFSDFVCGVLLKWGIFAFAERA